MSARKGFAHIILISVIAATLVIFGLVYFKSLQKTPYTSSDLSNQAQSTINKADPTSTWKTYLTEKNLIVSQPDKKYKYSLKYPSDWTYQENGQTTFFLPPNEVYEKDKVPKSIYIIVRSKNAAVLPVYIKYKTLREVKIENETVKVLQAENLATEKYLVEITRDDYVIRFTFGQYLDSKYDYLFDQILSTFKFE